jgi:hypothetical protein
MEITSTGIRTAVVDGATTLTEVARAVGFKGKTLSGSTADAIRKELKGIDKCLARNRAARGKAVKGKRSRKGRVDTIQEASKTPQNPFRRASVYAIIFEEGSKGPTTADKLLKKVHRRTGVPLKKLGHNLRVVTNENQGSNDGRVVNLCGKGWKNGIHLAAVGM